MRYWEKAIYESLESLGGEACLPEIYKKLPAFIDFTEKDLRITKYGERPAYQHIVRSYISNMCRSGLFRKISRGCYQIIEYVATKD
jgi:hypothetical protein